MPSYEENNPVLVVDSKSDTWEHTVRIAVVGTWAQGEAPRHPGDDVESIPGNDAELECCLIGRCRASL